MNRLIKPIAAILAASSVAACGVGDGFRGDQNFNNRVYIGGGGLISDLEPDTSEAPGVSVDDSSSGGGSVFVGYDLSSRFAVEGYYADLGESELSPSGSVDYQVGGLSALVYGLNSSRNRLTRTGFAGFGRLGIGGLNNDADGVEIDKVNDAQLVVGAGLEYGFANGLAGRAEYIAQDRDVQYGQLSLLYRFGAATPISGPRSPVVEQRNAEPDPAPEPVVEPSPVPQGPVAVPTPLPAPVASDTDQDGIADDVDVCPDSQQGVPVDDTGCRLFGGAIDGVNFLSGSDQLADGASVALDDVVDKLNKNPDVKILIQAHTDNTGDATDNLELSRQRAISVARYLVEQGISGSRLRAQAFGESEPRASNETPEGRAANRRVEFDTFE